MLECLSDVTYGIRRGGRTNPKTVHVSQLWRYNGLWNYTWDNNGRLEANKDVMDVQKTAGANEGVDSDRGDLDFSAKGAEGGDLQVSADVLETTLETDNNEGQQEAGMPWPRD